MDLGKCLIYVTKCIFHSETLKQHLWHHLQTPQRQTWPSWDAILLLSWDPSAAREVGGVQSWVKMRKQNVNYRTGHSCCFHSITAWQIIISCLAVWEIINFRKTKCVEFNPAASDCFCVFNTLDAVTSSRIFSYLLIHFAYFILAVGWKRSFNLNIGAYSIQRSLYLISSSLAFNNSHHLDNLLSI